MDRTQITQMIMMFYDQKKIQKIITNYYNQRHQRSKKISNEPFHRLCKKGIPSHHTRCT